MIGIYLIKNKIDGNCYVGKSVNIKRRWDTHNRNYIIIGKVFSDYPIYKAMREYGIENFEFSILEECKEECLTDRETYWYLKLKPKYNKIAPFENPMNNEEVKKHHNDRCKESFANRDDFKKSKSLENLELNRKTYPVKVVDKETGDKIIFDSLKEASEYTKVPKSTISQILNPNHRRKK